MEKIIGVLGLAVIAATIFFSANNVSGSISDASLASLTSLNEAHADAESNTTCTVTTKCFGLTGYESGSVSCTGSKCTRTTTSVTCDGKKLVANNYF